jgi:site-specific recombinase XerD
VTALTERVIPLGPILREADRRVKDKSYRRTPVGQEVGRFIRALRWADAAENTLKAYEPVLAKLALRHDDFDSLEGFCSPVGTDYIREFLGHYWSDSSPATKKRQLAAVKSFFQWAVDDHRIPWNPAASIKSPKGKGAVRMAHPRVNLARLVQAQDSLRDQCALQLYVWLGLRKMDVGLLQIRDIDLSRDVVVLRHGKGGEEALLPIENAGLSQDLYLHINGESRKPAEYLLYPRGHRERPMNPSSVHRWFKRCLEKAGLPQSVMLHELRHSAGDDLWRVTGDLVLSQQLLRHKSPATTRLYIHPGEGDLRAAQRKRAESWSCVDEEEN